MTAAFTYAESLRGSVIRAPYTVQSLFYLGERRGAEAPSSYSSSRVPGILFYDDCHSAEDKVAHSYMLSRLDKSSRRRELHVTVNIGGCLLALFL